MVTTKQPILPITPKSKGPGNKTKGETKTEQIPVASIETNNGRETIYVPKDEKFPGGRANYHEKANEKAKR